MNPQDEIEILTDHLGSLEAAANATRQRLEQLREAERPWPSVREARRALQNEWDPYELVALLGVGQDSDCEVYAYGVVRNNLQMQSASARMGKYSEHPAGWRNSWTPAHEMRQDDPKPTRYPWHEAPEWAQWAATDSDGDIWWYRTRPRDWRTGWFIGAGDTQIFKAGAGLCPDWRDSLEARP